MRITFFLGCYVIAESIYRVNGLDGAPFDNWHDGVLVFLIAIMIVADVFEFFKNLSRD